MKKINVTFSIPKETNELLHGLIGRRKMSSFVTEILNKALEDKARALAQEYAEAESDKDRNEVIEDWKVLDGENWE